MSKILVIAGTIDQANHWIRGNLEKRMNEGITTLSRSEYIIVSDINKIRGISNPHGVFVGTWRERKDITEIVQNLIYSSDINKQLHDIHNSLKYNAKL